MGHGAWGMGHGKKGNFFLFPLPIAHCPMPNAQCPITYYLYVKIY
ncbi:hypothetical protein [Tolypothrix sp. VBCCA 56010]